MIILQGAFQSGKTQAVIQRAVFCFKQGQSFQIITPSRLLNNTALSRFLSEVSAVEGRPIITLGELETKLIEHCYPNPALRPKTLGNFEQFLLISSVITNIEKELPAFPNISQRPRLIKSLYGLIRSLRDENALSVPAEDSLRLRAEGLQRIISEYQNLLDKRGLCDGAQAVRLLEGILPKSNYNFAKNIFIDGFTDLTASQFLLLKVYIACAEKIGNAVTLTLPHSRSALSIETAERFKEAFPQAQWQILDGQGGFGESFLKGESLEKAPAIYEVQAFGLHRECEEAANQIKKLLLFKNMRPDDILIISPKHETYAPILSSVFRKALIPLKFTKDELLKLNPLVIFLKQCLLMIGRPLTHESLSFLAKSNYVKPALRTTLSSAPLLVPQALDAPASLWQQCLRESKSEEESQKAALAEGLTLLEQTLLSLDLYSKYPVQRFFGVLVSFMEGCGIYEAPEGGAKDSNALHKLKEVFSQLKKSLLLVGGEKLALQMFLFYFDSIIEETRYPADFPKSGAVTVISLDEARGLSAKAVFFLGMNEGAFPPAPAWDLFDNINRVRLNRASKEILGRSLWDTDARHFQRSKFLFASALSLASQELYFCRTPSDERGNYFSQSHFLTRILSMAPYQRIPEHTSTDPRAQNPEIFALARSPEAVYASCFLPYGDKNPDLEQIQAYTLAIKQAQSALEQGVLPQDDSSLRYFGNIGASSEPAKKYQGSEVHVSPSKIDGLGRCLYQGLWKYIWNIKGLTLPEYAPEAAEAGIFYHRVLEAYLSQNKGTEFDGALLKGLILEIADTFPQKNIFILDYHHLYAVLKKFLKNIQAELIKTQSPERAEYPLDTTQGIVINEQTIRVHGVIDRLDADNIEGRHIIDYKTTGFAYGNYYKTLFCLFQGALYAMVLEAANMGPVNSITYMFLESGDKLGEYPPPKAASFNSLSEYLAYKKEELAALLNILKEGRFLPYTLPATMPLSLMEITEAVHKKIEFEYGGKCTYCDYQCFCPRLNKLTKDF